MKFAEFHEAHEAAKEALRAFEGDHEWPGLTPHDRVYALPADYQGEEYSAFVRVDKLHDHASCPIQIEVWRWHWRDAQEAQIGGLSANQLVALAEIKRWVRRWLDGIDDELPPSTCRRYGTRP